MNVVVEEEAEPIEEVVLEEKLEEIKLEDEIGIRGAFRWRR